jgi:putative selenate reductase
MNMSDRMRVIEYRKLLLQILKEYEEYGTFFYVPVVKIKKNESSTDRQYRKYIHNRYIEAPLGPAAGPHTQLAHNILSAYAAGARYFELKTVQILEGESLGIKKPCILVKDEAYNIEWSTELTINEAYEEYAKAWFLLKLLSREFGLGEENGFIFNMSVGYTLEGIKSQKIDTFIENMKEAKETKIWMDMIQTTKNMVSLFHYITEDYIDSIDSRICDTITLSTMHGCPVEEIEEIGNYLLEEKKLNLLIKCNPTLLGYKKVRETLDSMGYEYISFEEEDFKHDLSFTSAVELISRLKNTAEREGREFAIKLTNTFPVRVRNQELDGSNMYMSGAALYPLSIGVAALLAEAFNGDIMISYSGGADDNNILAILETGIRPITVSTMLLKQGGYKNLTKLYKKIEAYDFEENPKIDVKKLNELAEDVIRDTRYHKPVRTQDKKKKDILYSPFCSICKNCVDVCPNRANILIEKDKKKFTVHMDHLCNECGNCSYFCPLGHEPYKEKMTLFSDNKDFYNSENDGLLLHNNEFLARINGLLLTEIEEMKNDSYRDFYETVVINHLI